MQEYATAHIERLGLTPDADQSRSIESIGALRSYLDSDIETAVRTFESKSLPLYDLLFALMIADQSNDAKTAARIATAPLEVSDSAGKVLEGDDAVAQVKRDITDWHGDEDGFYVILCKGDEDAFKAVIGDVDGMRDGACEAPFDTLAVRRVFGVLLLKPNLSGPEAFRAAMEFAYRNRACEVASAVLENAWHWNLIAESEDSAPWQIIDTATLCAAELISGVRL